MIGCVSPDHTGPALHSHSHGSISGWQRWMQRLSVWTCLFPAQESAAGACAMLGRIGFDRLPTSGLCTGQQDLRPSRSAIPQKASIREADNVRAWGTWFRSKAAPLSSASPRCSQPPAQLAMVENQSPWRARFRNAGSLTIRAICWGCTSRMDV